MEVEPDDLLNPNIPLGREIYITEDSIALAALVDEMDNRVFKPWEAEE